MVKNLYLRQIDVDLDRWWICLEENYASLGHNTKTQSFSH